MTFLVDKPDPHGWQKDPILYLQRTYLQWSKEVPEVTQMPLLIGELMKPCSMAEASL